MYEKRQYFSMFFEKTPKYGLDSIFDGGLPPVSEQRRNSVVLGGEKSPVKVLFVLFLPINNSQFGKGITKQQKLHDHAILSSS